MGRFGIAGQRLDDPETQERMKRGWECLNPGVTDPVARLQEQEQDGIVGEVMYPSINMFTFGVPDREVVQAVFRRHNDWIVEYCSHAPEAPGGGGVSAPPRRGRGDCGAAAGGAERRAGRGDPLHGADGPAPTAMRATSRSGRRRRRWGCR